MKTKIKILIARTAPFVLSSVFAAEAFARKQKVEKITPDINSIGEFIRTLLDIVIKIGVPIAAIFLIWSGYLFVSAQGNEEKLKKAKHTFVWTCVGAAVLFGSWLLATAIEGTVNELMK